MSEPTKDWTRVYGASDDLVEVEGAVTGEVGCYGAGVLLVFSDGTLIRVKYGKPCGGVWALDLVHRGELLEDIVVCTDEDSVMHSDVAHFRPGLKWAYAAKDWERVS